MKFNFSFESKKDTKEPSKNSFLKPCIIGVIGICFIVYCLTSNGYNFDIKIEKERTVIQGIYNCSTQN